MPESPLAHDPEVTAALEVVASAAVNAETFDPVLLAQTGLLALIADRLGEQIRILTAIDANVRSL